MGERRTVAFELERVTVQRAGRRILDELTATIPAAGITVVSGPSGAGKTTLLRLCNRLAVPDAGIVYYRSQPLDEPTSALDAQPKQVFEATARHLAAQGITIVWVTHDDTQAARVADRIYQLRDGHLTGAPMKEVRP